MKKKIIVIGCGEHSRVVIENLEQQNKYTIFGLVSEKKSDVGKKVNGYRVICEDKDLKKMLSNNKDIKGYILGVGLVNGGMNKRLEVSKKISTFLNPINVIHPTAIISKKSSLGLGNVIEAFTKISGSAVVRNHCVIQSFTSINHDIILEDNVLIATNVTLAGKRIGANSVIADGASISFKKNVGKNCLLMDGSVLTKDMPNNSLGYGNPAKIIKKNNKIVSNLKSSLINKK